MIYPYYPVFLYDTTVVDPTFPNHHWPLEHTRHSLGLAAHAVGEFFNPYEGHTAITPRSDIRETEKRFYIDVELPGLLNSNGLKVKWLNRRTLYIEANTERPQVPEEKELLKIEGKGAKTENSVHQLAYGRHIGQFVRSFYFGTDVDQDSIKTSLAAGLLSIAVEKKAHEQGAAKSIEVSHGE